MAPKGFWRQNAIPFVMDHKLNLSSTLESRSVLSLLLHWRLNANPAPLYNRASLKLDKHAWEWIAPISVHQALPPATWEPGDEAIEDGYANISIKVTCSIKGTFCDLMQKEKIFYAVSHDVREKFNCWTLYGQWTLSFTQLMLLIVTIFTSNSCSVIS